MASDALNVSVPSLIVYLALIIFLVLLIHLVPVHHRTVLISAILDLIGELRVLLSNPDLFLQPLLLVVQLTQAILQHLCLDLLLLHVELLPELS